MRARLVTAVAASALSACLLAGCTGQDSEPTPTTSSTSTSASPEQLAADYLDKVCSATSAFATVQKTPPGADVTDPGKRKELMAVYMGQFGEAFTRSATELRAVGESPVAGGDQVVEKMAATFSEMATVFTDAKSAVEQADANDQYGGLAPARDALAKLADFSVPLKEVESTPELAAAARKAPKCQALRTATPSPSATAGAPAVESSVPPSTS
ncbi:hypothetical protein [Actinosynnema mirum]|uniref:Uncharacterized protein n=2 Tax=Actinosynnema TaxID=40566 RepID=C6WFC2_ACTMD|nr:hypothetical protein [Actinosynnema mirum]ACU34254.1 hypothetical protein Amir_0285 [Actinosynnema mirum DSM 43827]AXX27629.1 hypothetical protein APASM_0264 [Actinosynnema pretiosum subsp. pretiosum]